MAEVSTPTDSAAQTAPDAGQKTPDAAAEPDPSAKFQGSGVSFRAKVIGIEDVTESRGDKMCQDSILKLKGNVKVSGQHKQKIVINVSMSGIKLIDLMTAQALHEHRVDRISFIARDLTDRRAFGYIVGDDEGNHKFYAIKTSKVAEQVVLVLRDLFQVVYNMKQKEVETAKAQSQVNDAPPSAQPANTTAESEQKQPAQGAILNLEQELQNMQQMSDMDAFKTSWPANSPTTPDTSNTGTDSDIFGMANLSDISSLSSDFSLTSSTNLSTSNDHAKLKDSKTKLHTDAHNQEFRRSSSQKSAASWNGTTSSASALTQKRHASLTVARAKELKDALPDLTSQPIKSQSVKVKRTESEKSQNLKQIDNATVSPTKKLEKSSPDSLSFGDGKTPESEIANDSFFEEVMAATGLSPDKTTDTDDKASDRTKVSETNNDLHSSRSSLSSSGSKKSHKSRSINNLFFGKSDKTKSSSKRKNKVGRHSSTSSVASVTDKATTTMADTLSDTKSVGSPENAPTITSSSSSLRSRRKSSSSSTTSFDRASREHPALSPQAEAPPNKPRSIRIRPSAAVARQRPRAAPPQTGSSNPRNPPMFKTTSRIKTDPDDPASESKEPLQNTVDSPTSVRSAHSTASSANPTCTEQLHETETTASSWACFDESNSNDSAANSKLEDRFTSSAWESSDVETKRSDADDAWNAFGESNDTKKEKGENETTNAKKAEDAAFSSDPFANSGFESKFSDEVSAKSAWNAFENKDEEKTSDNANKLNNSDFPEDPFSNNTISDNKRDEFESCDPFAEAAATPTEDPFQNFEAVFGLSTDSNLEEKGPDKDKDARDLHEVENSQKVESDDPFQKLDAVFGNAVNEKTNESDEMSKTDEQSHKNHQQSQDLFYNFDSTFGPTSGNKTESEIESSKIDKKANKTLPVHENQAKDEDSFFDFDSAFGNTSNDITEKNNASFENINDVKSSELAASENIVTSQGPFYKFESTFGDAFNQPKDKNESIENVPDSSKSETFKSNVDAFETNFFENLSQTPSVSNKNSAKSSPAIPSSSSSTQSRKSSFHSSASSRKTTSPFPEAGKPKEDISWATFDADHSDIFDNVPFKSEPFANNTAVLSLPAPTSPPPPLPPRPPRRTSIPITEENPPVVIPPPLPTRPRISSKVVEETSSSSESESESSTAPPSFLPPQLPPLVQSSLPVEEEQFNNSANFEVNFPTSFQPSSEEEVDLFDLPFKNRSPAPPVIPKRNPPKQTSQQSPIYENNFTLQDSSGGNDIKRNASYGDDLAGFSMEALQPAGNGAAKLTKDQILAGFGQGQVAAGMYQQPQMPTHPFAGQQVAYNSPPMSPAFGGQFNAAPQAPMAGFPVGPRPAVPVRSGAMRPPQPLTNQNQSPFGDVQTPSASVLAPVNMRPDLANGSTAKDEKERYDPFGNLVPGMGKGDKKDMFKNFKIAKPASKSDLQQENTNSQNAFAPNVNQSSGDPFASMNNSSFGNALNVENSQQPQQANNFDSLFG